MNKYLRGNELPFWLFTFSILVSLTVPKLIQDGMFLDGMLYTCVSHNLANGLGTFWEPFFSPSYFNAGSPAFHEHPPLVFGIQSLFFRILGDSMYVERFYIFLIMCITAWLIHLLWKEIFREQDGIGSISWLPVIFWIIIPTSFWTYSNNMMENTMSLFDITAVLFIYRSINSGKNKPGLLLMAGFFIFLATFSKGVPGFFPLAIPLLHKIVLRKTTLWKAIIQTLLLISIPAIFYFILFNLPGSSESLRFYVTERLLQRVNEEPTVANRFHILYRLLMELLPLMIITILVIGVTKLKNIKLNVLNNVSVSLLFFLTGLAAAGPLVLTKVQRGFYLVPSLPYFALCFSVLIAPHVFLFSQKIISDNKTFKIFRYSAIIFLILVITFSIMQKGKTSRDRDMLNDVHAIGNTIPRSSSIRVSQELSDEYVLGCYFIRYYDISLYVDEQKDYLMVKKQTEQPDSLSFNRIDIDTKRYNIYAKKDLGN